MKPFRIGRVCDFEEGRIKTFRFLAKPIAVWRRGNDFFAIENACLHMRAQLLNAGDLITATITCPWHGWQYELGSGTCLNQKDMFLKRYAVTIDNDEVLLDISAVLG